MLERADFDRARRVELELTLAGAPGRVVGRPGAAFGVVLARPAHRAALARALGAPVRLVRRGRGVVVWPAEYTKNSSNYRDN